jgi:GT2 family glycosyltransferase
MAKIGLGIITCNRPEFLKKCYDSVPRDKIDCLIVINDGEPLPFTIPDEEYLHNEKNLGVGRSKNKALQYLIFNNCDYLFLIEDDIYITNPEVFNEYIKYIEKTGIQHLMFGYHGPANKKDGKPIPRLVIDYGNNINLALNYHCVGAFCVYTSKLLTDIGLFDDEYVNAWEHVDHSYQAVKKGYLPAYWWWPDIQNSYDFLAEQACSEVNSSIRPREDWRTNIQNGARYFFNKNKYTPWQVPDESEQSVIKALRKLKSK